jgi:DNA-binding response OmpR family regulator
MGDHPADGAPGAGSASLLVVEDFAPLSVLLVGVLGAEGYRVRSESNGPAAEAACAQEDFDLIVTDVHIPGGNGADIARRVASRRPGLRVLFVSGSEESELDLQVSGGHTDFLQKPFDIYELVERVRHLLEGDGPARPPAHLP